MKEITRIHLAATPYNIEVSAKKVLEKYIQEIEKALAADDETLREIEARMIELLEERGVKGEQVITGTDISALKERLGAPGEFIDEPVQVVSSDKKRLMRDEQRGMVGGVLSGVAAYTGVDVAWYRVAAIILAFMSFGTMLLVYAVLWVAIPPARTAAERLQMRGERASLENIQAESVIETHDTPSHKKPLVVMFRVLGALGLLGLALCALAVVAAALFTGLPILGVADWMTNGWLIAALLVGSLSGILFVALMCIGIYMIIAWHSSKVLTILSGVVVVAGLVTFGISAGMAIQGAQQMKATVDEHTTTRREKLPALQGAESLFISQTSTPVTYKVTEDEPYAEIKTFQQNTAIRVPVTVTREGEVATLKVGEIAKKDCAHWIDECTVEHASVTVYGPSLKSLDIFEVDATYETEDRQQALNATIRDGASLRMTGRLSSLNATLKAATLTVEDAAIDDVVLHVDDNAQVSIGVVRALTVTVPTSCAANNNSEIEYDRTAKLLINGKPADATSMLCVELKSTEENSAPEA